MKQTQIIMGMPITVRIEGSTDQPIKKVFNFFKQVDQRFSTYKKNSEVSKLNRGELKKSELSDQLKLVQKLCQETKLETDGYFDPIDKSNNFDPSGIVNGWAINEAGKILRKEDIKIFFIDAGGDIQVSGKIWKVGIRNPFSVKEIIKVIEVKSEGVATSGTYERGQHIYNPKTGTEVEEIVSLTVIGSNIYEADRFATAAFAMGKAGINFIEQMQGLEGYMIDDKGIATLTSGFTKYVVR
jgi:thiamine biosynthesis lipoprotein